MHATNQLRLMFEIRKELDLRSKWQNVEHNCMIRSFIICTNIINITKSRRVRWMSMKHAWESSNMKTEFQLEYYKRWENLMTLFCTVNKSLWYHEHYPHYCEYQELACATKLPTKSSARSSFCPCSATDVIATAYSRSHFTLVARQRRIVSNRRSSASCRQSKASWAALPWRFDENPIWGNKRITFKFY